MKIFALIAVVCLALCLTADAFVSNSLSQVRTSESALMAKHVQPKGAKKHVKNRPRKSRLSDIHRKPTSYKVIEKGPDFTVIEEPSD
mmetsp:Transcript_23426/g.37002  ORF Transcript_23426/g.37002 Transcript_23426/m.37002 type:complete len:87 (-) Transcript_23426:496-756(-)